MNGISVVIPNFNGMKLLEQNLPLLYTALDATKLPFEVIIADDASSDDSLAFLRHNYPDIKVVKGDVNTGFSVNINRGIQLANYSHTFLMNSDIELTRGYFLDQLNKFHDDVFGCMGSIWAKDIEGKEVLQDAAKYPAFTLGKLKGTVNYHAGNKVLESFFLSGANAFVDTKKLKALNGFNEIFSPFYMEDFDLGLRANRMGWKCFYIPSAICYHPISTTIGKYHHRLKVKKVAKRNSLMIHQLHLKGLDLVLFWIRNSIQFVIRIFIFDRIWYTSFFEFVGKLKDVEHSKKEKYEFRHTISSVVQRIERQIPTTYSKF